MRYTLAGNRQPRFDMSNTPEKPFPVSYWVQPGRLLAGEYPLYLPNTDQADGYDRPTDNRERVRRLLAAGVTLFIDLTEENEQAPYMPLVEEEAARLGVRVEHHRWPLKDLAEPPEDKIVAILDDLDAALRAGHTVYVHCKAGVGRTGVVVGTYLVRRGLPGEEALAQIARWREDVPDDRPSPLVERQRELVRRWSEDGRE